MRSRRQRAECTNAGFTLIEVMAVMSIAGILMSIAAFGFTNWRNTAQHQGSAQELVSALRNASVRSVSEGRTYCVDITGGTSYSLWRYACTAAAGGAQIGGTLKPQSPKVTLLAVTTPPTPAPSCTDGHKCLYFYPRGTAVPATVTVASTARSKVFIVRVEGLTARVYM